MIFDIKLDTSGPKKKIGRFLLGAGDLSEPNAEIALYLAGVVDDAFAEETDPETNTAWEPIALSTELDKERKGYGGSNILERTGQLRYSFESDYDHKSAWVGTNLEYAAVHQFGHQFDNHHLPERSFLGLDESDLDWISKTYGLFFVRTWD